MMDPNAERELKALISLADEPDDRILSEIIQKIISYGKEAIPFLEEKWENSLDNILQERVLNIIHKIQFENICNQLKIWAQTPFGNMFTAFILISKFQYPMLNEKDVHDKLENIKKDVWLEMNDNLTPLEKVRVINHILFDIHKFAGNVSDFYALSNMYLNTLLETKKGNPLSLGLLYIIISNEMNIPVYGVNLPEHFILAYTNENKIDRLGFLDEKEVLFYINPFSKGAVFSKKEVEQFLSQINQQPQDSFYQPCNNTDIVNRLLNNLSMAYQKIGDKEKVDEIQILFKIINNL
ncbi:MAG TPA: transglutaminase-like domain-containing protein [Bacteroidales bacterium]|nr:transglutaminase-like domain-containing protein [Bacteroidales bacterium]